MVLSNKKLKRKLREELSKSLSATSATGQPDTKPSEPAKPDRNQSESPKELLDSVALKPRLSKREKRRKNQSLKVIEGNGKEVEEKRESGLVVESENGEKKRKKRKRDGIESGGGEDGDGFVGEGENVIGKEKKKGKKKKMKKKKKKKTESKEEEEKVGSEEVAVMESPVNVVDWQADGVVPKKVYAGGIPYHYTEDDIRSYFKSCGAIAEVDCKMRSEDGKFTGIAFISFETEDAAKRALALDRAAMGDCFLTIQQYVKAQSKRTSDFAPEMVEGYNRIYIGNLAWDTTEHDIRKLFSDCVITSIRFGRNKETGEFKGYAHVDFKDGVSMAMALKLDQQVLHGRPVKISCAVPRKGPSNESNNGGARKEETKTDITSVPAESEAINTGSTSAVSSGKIRRRTCYECGEKGHLSSACPKKQTADQTNSNTD